MIAEANSFEGESGLLAIHSLTVGFNVEAVFSTSARYSRMDVLGRSCRYPPAILKANGRLSRISANRPSSSSLLDVAAGNRVCKYAILSARSSFLKYSGCNSGRLAGFTGVRAGAFPRPLEMVCLIEKLRKDISPLIICYPVCSRFCIHKKFSQEHNYFTLYLALIVRVFLILGSIPSRIITLPVLPG